MEIRAFQLGLALDMPAAEVSAYLKSVEALSSFDDNQNAPAIARLAAEGDALRRQEKTGYTAAYGLVQDMGGAHTNDAWIADAVGVLSKPLVITKAATQNADSDPNSQAVLSVIDEADTLRTAEISHKKALLLWINVSAGRAAVWHEALGGLAASITAAAQSHRGTLVSPEVVKALLSSAPSDTSPTVLNALTALAGRSGDLAGVVRTAPVALDADQAREFSASVLEAYRSAALADSIAHPQ